MRRFPLLIVICALAILGLAACGGDDNKDTTTAPATTETTTTDTSGGAGKTVEQAADPSGGLKFEKDSLSAPTGNVTFKFTNESSTPHDFVVEQDGQELAKTDVITEGSDTTQATLEAGEYTFYCSVPGHRQAGMEGTLTSK